jgi:hypothetical protein
MPLDKNGFTSVSKGSAAVGIHVLESEHVLLFLVTIMPVPAAKRLEFYRKLLELNHTVTADAAFSIDASANTVHLKAMRTLAGLDYEEFEDMLHTVATVADDWDDRLIAEFGEKKQESAETSPQDFDDALDREFGK